VKVINKSYKVRIYPNNKQIELLDKHFGCVRFIYNHFLNIKNSEYKETGKNLSYYDLCNRLTTTKNNDNYIWLNDVNSQSLQWSIRFLDIAFNNFFNKKSNFPNFKKKSNDQSFKVPVNSTFKLLDRKIIFPKFKEGIKYKGKIDLDNLLKFNSITISKTPSGKYYASLQGEFNYEPKEKCDNIIGIDLGVKDFLVTDKGIKVDNPKHLNKSLKKLKYNQRQLSKKIKGSKNRNKQRIIVAKIYEKVTNKRNDFLHKLSSKIVNENQVICLEDLSVKNMVKNHKLAQSISDVSWTKFVNMLKYKSEWNDRELVQINRFYPSSKSCSECHYINDNLTLKDREWTCTNCNITHDRDINAAKNILKQGINILSGYGAESDTKQKQVETLPLGESMKPETKPSLVVG
jgi:putative transposase